MLIMENLPKTYQYITIDSRFVGANKNNFTVHFGQPAFNSSGSQASSNVIIREQDSVIGLKLVEFYVTQIGEGTENGAKFIDVLCPEIPTPAQILDQRHGRVFAKVGLERTTSNITVFDKIHRPCERKQNYFNPISISKLSFQMFQQNGGAGPYQTLNPNANYYMILEVTSINPDHIEDDIITPLDKLTKAVDTLNKKINKMRPITHYYYPAQY